jgi:hypothetical protein
MLVEIRGFTLLECKMVVGSSFSRRAPASNPTHERGLYLLCSAKCSADLLIPGLGQPQ